MYKKNYCILILVFVVFNMFSFNIYSIENTSSNIFENDIFSGIARSPECYKNNSSFSVIERTPEQYSYAIRFGADLESIIRGDGIEIVYWRIFGVYKIHVVTVTISEKNNASIFGKYIGMSKSELLAIFSSPESENKTELYFESNNSELYVNFQLKDDVVYEIIFGYSI